MTYTNWCKIDILYKKPGWLSPCCILNLRVQMIKILKEYICVRSRNCGCLVTWFCYQLIAKPGNKTATVSWPDPSGYKIHFELILTFDHQAKNISILTSFCSRFWPNSAFPVPSLSKLCHHWWWLGTNLDHTVIWNYVITDDGLALTVICGSGDLISASVHFQVIISQSLDVINRLLGLINSPTISCVSPDQ